MRNGVIGVVSALAVALALALALGSAGMVTASALAATGTATTAGQVAPAGTAKPGIAPVSLPISSFYQIVADPAEGYLFISAGSNSYNEILVTNLAGQEVGTITGQDGVMGLALSADGSTLYAALSADHSVTAIDTSTLQQTASYPIGDANTPLDVAVQSGKLWVSYDTTAVNSGAIGDINLSATQPAFETQAAMGGWYSTPEIAADPQDTGILAAAEPGLTPAPAATYDVSADPATVLAQKGPANTLGCDNESDLAVVPGGAEVILACGSPYAFYRYSAADLSQQGSYAGVPYPVAVAIDASGDVAGGTADGTASDPDIYIYKQGGDTPLGTDTLGASGAQLAPRGLAWAPDGSQLFAVMATGIETGSYFLQVIDNPTLTSSALTITGPSAADVTQSVTLTGSLTVGGAAPTAGTPVTITRTVAGSTATQTFNVTTAADGSFTLQDTPPAVGQYTYTASYAGSTTIAPATASQAVSVTVIPATLTMSGPSTVVLTQGLTLTGTLAFAVGTPAAGTPVTVTRMVAGSTATQTFSVTTAAGGSFTLQDIPPAVGQYTYTASYAGSATVAPATGSQLVSVTLTPATLTLSGPATVRITKSVTLTGSLTIDGTPSEGTPVTVTRTVAGSTATRTFSVTTGAGGGFSVTDTPPAAGQYTYTARYAGSATVGPATAARPVSVTRNPVSLRVAASGPATRNYEAAVKVTARLGSTYSSRSVSIYAQSFGSTARTLVKTGRVNSHGELTVSYKPRHSTTFVAAFSGDARSAPETATVVVHVRAKVTESLGGNYGTQKIGGVTYRLYHHNGHMDVYTAVYPNKSGECIKYQLAIEYRGTWQSAAPTTCGRLSSSSKIAISVPLSQSEAGYRYRIRSEYDRPGSDVSNVNNDSAWQYLIIES